MIVQAVCFRVKSLFFSEKRSTKFQENIQEIYTIALTFATKGDHVLCFLNYQIFMYRQGLALLSFYSRTLLMSVGCKREDNDIYFDRHRHRQSSLVFSMLFAILFHLVDNLSPSR